MSHDECGIPQSTKHLTEQRLMLPGTYTWQDFEVLEQLFDASSRLRMTYKMDGLS